LSGLAAAPMRLLILLLALGLAACARPPVQEQQAYVFGTRVEVIVVSAEAARGRQAIAAVLREFDRLHRAYHAWQPSELTALNAALAAGQPHAISPELAGLIRDTQELSAQGDYLFDPGIGQLIRLWGFQNDEFAAELPPPPAIAAWLAEQPSVADIAVDGNAAQSRTRRVALDFGGYLKGVALDRAALILRQQGIDNALINIGGNVLALGSRAGRAWRVGIQHPRQPGPLATVNLADGEAIGTSGDYQRFFEVDGKRYAHLLDPRMGYPAEHTQAVTVLLPAGPRAGTLSDAVSKPIFIAGPEHWRTLAEKMGVAQALRIDADGRVFVTTALHRRLEFIGGPPADLIIVP